MDTRTLEAFTAVVDNKSFSRAADQLHLTQPAISKRIAALEQELGTRLFDRIGRQPRLTESGRVLLPRARAIISEIEESRRLLGNLSGQVRGTLNLATSHHIGLHHLPMALRSFSDRYPRVILNLHFLGSEKACTAVAQGDIELAVITIPQPLPSNLISIPLWRDRLIFVCAPDHPLAELRRPTMHEINRHPGILPEQDTFTRQLINHRFEQAGLKPHTGMETNYLETIKKMVETGLGWSVLPATMLDEGLTTLQTGSEALERRLGIVHHRARTLSNAGTAWVENLKKARDE